MLAQNRPLIWDGGETIQHKNKLCTSVENVSDRYKPQKHQTKPQTAVRDRVFTNQLSGVCYKILRFNDFKQFILTNSDIIIIISRTIFQTFDKLTFIVKHKENGKNNTTKTIDRP